MLRILSLSVFCFFAFFMQAKAQQQLPEGLKIKNLDGKSVDLREQVQEGQITVLSFWATWCSPCKKELDNLMDLYPEWQEDYNVHIIAISIDDARTFPKVKGMVNSKGWEYTILSDQNQDLQRALNFQTVPQTFLINQAGEIIYSHAGYKEGDEYELEDKIKELAKNPAAPKEPSKEEQETAPKAEQNLED